MSENQMSKEMYEDIGTELEEAGWRLGDVALDETSKSVILTYSRYIDGEHVNKIQSINQSGSLARYAAIRRMQEETGR